jgi:5-formyltetrahydrofolate cyclo-ligase
MAIEGPAAVADAKRQLRVRLLAARADRSAAEREAAAKALCDRVLALPEVEAGPMIACYAPTAHEPGTEDLLHALSGLGHTLLLPVLQPDFDLSWAEHEPGELREARFGISEPAGLRLGVDAIREASVLICPALAVDLSGHRLGRGGGSYDRVLTRVSPSTLRVALVYDDEVLDAVPVHAHDQQVQVAVTPTRTLRLHPT